MRTHIRKLIERFTAFRLPDLEVVWPGSTHNYTLISEIMGLKLKSVRGHKAHTVPYDHTHTMERLPYSSLQQNEKLLAFRASRLFVPRGRFPREFRIYFHLLM